MEDKKPYVRYCCMYCTNQGTNCLGCSVSGKMGMKGMQKHCQQQLKEGICNTTFKNGPRSKKHCFVAADSDVEKQTGKSTSEIEVEGKKESEIIKEKPKVTLDSIAESLKALAREGAIDLNKLKDKLEQ